MQMGKTGESLNGLSHKLPNGTPFFFSSFFSVTLFCLKFTVLLRMMTLIEGCGSNVADKSVVQCYHLVS